MALRMGLLGKKIGMTQVFGPDGERVPVTAIATGPCVILAKRTPENDKYAAIQIGFEEKRASLVPRPQAKQWAKVEAKPPRLVREIRVDAGDLGKYEVGQILKLTDVFAKGNAVDVT